MSKKKTAANLPSLKAGTAEACFDGPRRAAVPTHLVDDDQQVYCGCYCASGGSFTVAKYIPRNRKREAEGLAKRLAYRNRSPRS